MIHADEPGSGTQHKPLGEPKAGEQAAQKTRPAGHGHCVDITRLEPGLPHKRVIEGVQDAVMLPRGNLRHHPSKKRVQGRLGRNDLPHEVTIPHQGHGGFITRGFYAENEHWCCACCFATQAVALEIRKLRVPSR